MISLAAEPKGHLMPLFLFIKIDRNSKSQVGHMKMKEGHASEDKKAITIKISAELNKLIDKERKLTGETITRIIERAVANLPNSDQRQPSYGKPESVK